MNLTQISSAFNIQSDFNTATWAKIKLFVKCFSLSILVKVAGGIAVSISSLLGFKEVLLLFNDRPKLSNFYSEELSLFLIIIIFPVLEEFAFRGWFTRNRVFISVSLTISSFYLFYILMYRWFVSVFPLDNSAKIAIIACGLFLASIYFYRKAEKIKEAIIKRWSFLIVTSICAFSAIHILNYSQHEFSFTTLAALAIILLPYPFAAYLYTYLRIKNGLIWSIALHVLNNAIILIPVLMDIDTI